MVDPGDFSSLLIFRELTDLKFWTIAGMEPGWLPSRMGKAFDP